MGNLEQEQTSVVGALERVRLATASDFAALARSHAAGPAGPAWRWTEASGNRSERYRLFQVKPGRGVAGIALLTGRPVGSDRHRYADSLRSDDFPLWQAEGLAAAAAVPVLRGDAIVAVLLIGARAPRPYDSAELEQLAAAAASLASTLPEL